MAKKTVASLQKGEGRTYSKVIKMVKSPKTGAYTFKEEMVPNDAVKDALKEAPPPHPKGHGNEIAGRTAGTKQRREQNSRRCFVLHLASPESLSHLPSQFILNFKHISRLRELVYIIFAAIGR